MHDPVVYRRRTELVEAIQVTAANAVGIAELHGGRVEWLRGERPLLYLPGSVHPARAGDYAVHRLTTQQPWYPMRGQAFTDAYEPACPACAQVR